MEPFENGDAHARVRHAVIRAGNLQGCRVPTPKGTRHHAVPFVEAVDERDDLRLPAPHVEQVLYGHERRSSKIDFVWVRIGCARRQHDA